MEIKSKMPAVIGRIAQVDICPSESGLVLSVGPVSLWLDLAVAEDVVETLTRALSTEKTVKRDELAAGEQAPCQAPSNDRNSSSN
jgi:hypothetical protein